MLDRLSDQEKSVLLAKAMRWDVWQDRRTIGGNTLWDVWVIGHDDDDGFRVTITSFYDPDNMALAWRVLNWAIGDPSFGHDVDHWLWNEGLGYDLLNLTPDVAQRAWLDKVLELAIEAGIVKLEQPE